MKLQDANRSFLARCVALNLAAGSVRWYRFILRDLAAFLESRGAPELGAVTPSLLREHLAHLREKGISAETVSRVYGAIRCAFRFWKGEGAIPTNPMELVERPRCERVLIRPFSPEQAGRLIEMPDVRTVEGLRDRAMLMLMLDSGLRISEVLSLEASRVEWSNCTATVMGKGRKERSVPFSEMTRQALQQYAEARAKGLVAAPQLFLGRTGKAVDRAKVRILIIRYGRQAGIEGVRLSPHTLRHTFAVLYIRNGGDSFSLQEILGHSTLEMTKRYVHLARRDVAEQHRKFSPMESLLRMSGSAAGAAGARAPGLG
ncbi:MAG: tyrosine-type recombinase/integrase [Elusimicrobia bacterium]|nr:tyrosine-type recombinase/integrase [Elusimicrobiota bacterium]